jgi:hypothetical protein
VTTPAGAATTPRAREAYGAPADRPDAPEEMVMFLERDQLVIDAARPVPRARLRRRTTLALWALRVLVMVVSAMVIYTFVSQIA